DDVNVGIVCLRLATSRPFQPGTVAFLHLGDAALQVGASIACGLTPGLEGAPGTLRAGVDLIADRDDPFADIAQLVFQTISRPVDRRACGLDPVLGHRADASDTGTDLLLCLRAGPW